MERIIVDMDEVIADPMGDMIDWYRREYGLDVDYGNMLGGSWVRGFPEQHRGIVMERLRGKGFFRGLPVMKDAVDVLREINQRYELFIVSAATEFPNSLTEKLDWLLEHFPFLTWKQLTLCGDKRLVFGDYMIDDHVRNLQTFTGRKYLFTSPHNLDITGYDRINNWQEAADIFIRKENETAGNYSSPAIQDTGREPEDFVTSKGSRENQ